MKELCYVRSVYSLLLLLICLIGSESIQESGFGCLWKHSRELNVELDKQVSFSLLLLAANLHLVLVIALFLCNLLDWHSFSMHNFACLRWDLLIESNCECASIESSKGAWSLLESINETNLLCKYQIITESLIVWVIHSSEFDSNIRGLESSCLVTLLFEHDDIDVATRSNLELLAHAFLNSCFSVMLHLILRVGDSFECSII